VEKTKVGVDNGDEVEDKGINPENTEKNTEWALRNFETWRIARYERHPNDTCAADIFKTGTDKEICDCLCKFITETSKTDGTKYVPRSM